MDAKQLREQYDVLRRRLDSGELASDAFYAEVSNLRMQGDDGIWYTLSPQDGSWLRWDGKDWQSASAPPETRAVPVSPQTSASPAARPSGEQVPTKFWPLFRFILKRTLKSFLKSLPKAILISILMMVVLWGVNFCIIAFKNDGYLKPKPVDRTVGIGFGNGPIGAVVGGVYGGIFLSIGSILLFNGIATIRRKGVSAAVSEVAELPRRMMQYFRTAGDVAWPGLMGGAGVALLIAVVLEGLTAGKGAGTVDGGPGYASAAVSIGLFSLIFSRSKQGLSMLMRAAWSSTYGTLKGTRGREFGLEAGYIAAFGGSVGFAMRFLLPWHLSIFIAIGLLIAAVYMVGGGDRRTVATASFLVGWWVFAAMLEDMGFSWAHDGGPWESNKSLGVWIKSAGAQRCAEIAGQCAVATGAMAGAMTMLGQGLTGALTSLGETAGAATGMATRGTYEDGSPLIYDENGDVVPRDENGDYIWEVGDETRHLTRDEVIEEIEENAEAVRRRDRERQDFLDETRRLSDEWMQRKHDEGIASQQQMEIRRALEEAQEQQLQRNRDHMIERLQEMGNEEDQGFRDHVQEMIEDQNYAGLEDLYRDRLGVQIREGQDESASQQRWATAFGVGEKIAQGTVAASRGALMVLGGPAGAGATALSIGAISAAQETADGYVLRGHTGLELVKDSSVGFLSGVKDGLIGSYVNVPGTSGAVRVLLPAAGDFGETYLRTGDVKRSLATAGVSAAGDLIGLGTDGMSGGITRELISGGTAGLSGGTLNVINGGDFGEGFQNGLVNYAGGRAGSRIGAAGVDHVNATEHQQRLDELEAQRQHGQENEDFVRQTMDETAETRRQTIPTEDQPEIIRQLDESRHQRVQYDEDGNMRVDANGDPVTADYVSTRRALEQLQDTRSSRTAKQSEADLREAIIRTRNEELYAPADQRTINRALDNPEIQNMMKPGDELVMDTFSTPGSRPSLGADRDARLTIKRPNPNSETGYDMIEVPRQHWENDAYRDFHNHSMEIMGGKQNVTPESHPEYYRRREELDYLKGAGYSQEDIDARAWGEAHNQLFTDRHHMEASMDNADQTMRVRPGGGGVEPGQDAPNVLRTQWGERNADGSTRNLKDAEGYSRMWGEKSRFYEGNTPEAVAQSQKGIDQHMRVRHGLREQGVEPPPLDNRTAAAMERISRAPVGADATPEAMNQLNRDLQNMGYRDTNDAMQKIASQNEGLKWSQPAGSGPQAPSPSQGLSPGSTIRTARNAMAPQEPQQPEVDTSFKSAAPREPSGRSGFGEMRSSPQAASPSSGPQASSPESPAASPAPQVTPRETFQRQAPPSEQPASPPASPARESAPPPSASPSEPRGFTESEPVSGMSREPGGMASEPQRGFAQERPADFSRSPEPASPSAPESPAAGAPSTPQPAAQDFARGRAPEAARPDGVGRQAASFRRETEAMGGASGEVAGRSPQGMGREPEGFRSRPVEGMGREVEGLGSRPQGMGSEVRGMGGSPQGMGGAPQGMGGTPQGMGGRPEAMGREVEGMKGEPDAFGGRTEGMGRSPEGMAGENMRRKVSGEREALMREREELQREREMLERETETQELAREREALLREREQVAREREELRRMREEMRRRRERGE